MLKRYLSNASLNPMQWGLPEWMATLGLFNFLIFHIYCSSMGSALGTTPDSFWFLQEHAHRITVGLGHWIFNLIYSFISLNLPWIGFLLLAVKIEDVREWKRDGIFYGLISRPALLILITGTMLWLFLTSRDAAHSLHAAYKLLSAAS